MKLLLQTKFDQNRNWYRSWLALSLKPNLVDILYRSYWFLVKLFMQVTYSDQRIEGAVKLSPGSTWSPGWDSLQARARGQPSTAASSGQPLRLSLSSFFFDTTDKFRNKLPKNRNSNLLARRIFRNLSLQCHTYGRERERERARTRGGSEEGPLLRSHLKKHSVTVQQRHGRPAKHKSRMKIEGRAGNDRKKP